MSRLKRVHTTNILWKNGGNYPRITINYSTFTSLLCALTFTTLFDNSADDKLVIFFLFSPKNKIWHFRQIVSSGDNLHEMSNLVTQKNKKKYFNVACWGLMVITCSGSIHYDCRNVTWCIKWMFPDHRIMQDTRVECDPETCLCWGFTAQSTH